MEITINGKPRQLVGNPPEVGDEFPHFKVFDKNHDKIKTRQLLGKVTLLSVVPNTDTPVLGFDHALEGAGRKSSDD